VTNPTPAVLAGIMIKIVTRVALSVAAWSQVNSQTDGLMDEHTYIPTLIVEWYIVFLVMFPKNVCEKPACVAEV
jgi:hypothetical protein